MAQFTGITTCIEIFEINFLLCPLEKCFDYEIRINLRLEKNVDASDKSNNSAKKVQN